jgi:signal transduction histidine kinase
MNTSDGSPDARVGPEARRTGAYAARGSADGALRFLSDASASLAESLDYETTVAQVAALAVPRFADWCVVDVMGTGRLERAAVACPADVPPELVEAVKAANRESDSNMAAKVLVQRASVFLPDIGPHELHAVTDDGRERSVIEAMGLRSLIAAPLIARGRALGVLTFGLCVGRRPYGAGELHIAEQLAHRAALSIDNARLYERAQQQSRAKDEFLAMLGHELRNPLSPMLTALDLMRLRGKDGRERAVLERQVRHLIRLVDDLLDISRITRGKVRLNRHTLELHDVVTAAVEVVAPLLEERYHDLTVNVPRTGLMVLADEERLVQVVSNLLANATKYTPPQGRIEIGAGLDDGEVHLWIRDSGVGISQELLPRIFDTFVQGERSLDRSEGGLGLGLAIVRNLVELHGGRVAASSDGPGRGSAFGVWLPPAVAGGSALVRARSAIVETRSRPRRVLLVDDNRDLTETMAELLTEQGHTVRRAHDGPEALGIVQTFAPEIAFVDLGLPVMDGYELARRLRELAPPAVLVAVTGYGQDADRARSAAAGFERHLVKPIDLEGLDAVMAEVLD